MTDLDPYASSIWVRQRMRKAPVTKAEETVHWWLTGRIPVDFACSKARVRSRIARLAEKEHRIMCEKAQAIRRVER